MKDKNQIKLDFSQSITAEEFLSRKVDIDAELKHQEDEFLHKWIAYIKEITDQAGAEFDWWFDTSAPYDCEIELVVRGHRCWGPCVSFRFSDKKLTAFDSNFGGGTSFLEPWERDTPGEIVRATMAKVLAKECENSKFNYNESLEEVQEHVKDHLICRQPNGWIDRKKLWKLDEYKIMEAKKNGTGTA
jgi:hypothetical protein